VWTRWSPRWRAAPGGGSSWRSWNGPIRRHLAEPAQTADARESKRRAKTDRTDARHLRQLLVEGRLLTRVDRGRVAPFREQRLRETAIAVSAARSGGLYRAYGVVNPGICSVNVRRWQSAVVHTNRRTHSRITTGVPPSVASRRLRR